MGADALSIGQKHPPMAFSLVLTVLFFGVTCTGKKLTGRWENYCLLFVKRAI